MLFRFDVLVVDDNTLVAFALESILQDVRATVRIVSTAEDALREIGIKMPDVVISDIDMPGMSGFDFARHVRSAYGLGKGRLPMIAHSGLEKEHLVEYGIAAGFDECVQKPADAQELIELIKKVIGERANVDL